MNREEEVRKQEKPATSVFSVTESEEGSLALTDSKQSSLSLTELVHAGLDIPSPFSKEIFLAHQSIVGTRYLGGSDELVEDLKPGDRVSFVTEPDNRFLGLPGAEILSFDDGSLHPCTYEATDSYQVTSMFINNREQILRRLLDE